MKLQDLLVVSVTGLKTNKSRSALTILGIVIGIMSIILVMSVGEGAQNLILDQIRGLGSRTIFVEPGREPTGPSSFVEMFTDSLKDRELEALRTPANVQNVGKITPLVMNMMSAGYGNETIRTNVLGASDIVTEILDVFPQEGIFFSEEEINQRSSVAVIGSEVREKLFGPSDALGKKIKIKDRIFRVIGILPPKGTVSLFNIDELIIVPYTTAQQYLSGINYYNSLIVQAKTEEAVPRVVQDIEWTLRELHGITDPEKDDFHVTTQANIAERVNMVTGILTVLLVSIAAISLLVGGIGIMNIMLVSVTERTREIGLRKALGATNRDVLFQFLLEAVILTLIGGILGILAGATLGFVASLILGRIVSLGWSFSFPVIAALLGVGVAVCVGLIFGIYPARKASRKSPMEALRYE